MPIIATAGHVDHGKSTLVEALTGRDPDRWAEEKERGLTIDLGFAWAEVGGTSVGFVDVPGHERFIKNMLAGVGGLDVALFVVAADEGWMPQSEEHLAVLDLLDVAHGVVALTRVDLADEDTIELARLEVEEHTADTALAAWPIVAVSAVTGSGMEDLRAALGTALATAGAPRDLGRPRLWVDRSFVIAGAGVVVTGTLLDGVLRAGTTAELWPGPQRVRIRGLQSHEAELETAAPGSRVAANLSGLEREDVARGALLSAGGQTAATRRILTELRPVRGVKEVTDRGAYQLHAGSAAWPVRVRTVVPGVAVITGDAEMPLLCGERFILRETGRRAVVGGGRVLDPRPRGRSSAQLAAAAGAIANHIDADPDALATTLLHVRGVAALSELEVDTKGGKPQAAVTGGGMAMDPAAAAAKAGELATTVAEFHAANPLRPGVPKATLASTHSIAPELLEAILAGHDGLVDDGATVRAASHGGGWGEAEEAAFAAAAEMLRTSGLAAPRAADLGLSPELLHASFREGRLTKIAADLAYLPEQIEDLTTRLAKLPEEFTVADFRDEMEITRRHAVPLLEWLDAGGWTARRGDVRSLRRSPPQ